jgi:nucleoside-diphosphate-sugar epimerase
MSGYRPHMARKPITDIDGLEDALSEPTPGVVESLGRLKGDIVVLGAGGKMGPSLARMARRASVAAGVSRRVVAVSRFSNAEAAERLEAEGVETIACNLLDEPGLAGLPDAPNVVYMAGMKFGATGNEPLTWVQNAFLPGLVCRKYRQSRIAAFSSGNVYGLAPVSRGGSRETDPTDPVGEYAWSVLGRERMFQHYSATAGTPVTLIRLNYACELRYGVLVDIARKVYAGQPVTVAMAYFNIVWQGDANAMALQCLELARSPALILNVTGPRIVRVREAAARFGAIMGKKVKLEGAEAPDALLGNAAAAMELFGQPTVTLEELIERIADWVMRGGADLGKPTHFESRDGKF